MEEFAGRLGYHFQQAGQDEKSRHYYRRAGDHAASLYANGEAIDYYRHVLEMIPDEEVGTESWVQFLRKLGRVHEMTGNWQEALSLYREIVREGIEREDPQMELEGLLPQVTIYSVPTDVRDRDTGPELAARALEIAEKLGDPEATARTLWNLLLQHYYMGMEYEKGIQSGERALKIARENELEALLPFILNDLGRAYASTFRFDEAIAAHQEAESIWRSEDNLHMLADNLTTSADLHFGIGDFIKSKKLATEAMEISRRIDNLWGQAYSMMVLAGTMVECGEISEGIEMIEECVRLGSQGNFYAASIFPPIYLGWMYSWLGAFDPAMEQLDRSIELMEGFPAFIARAQILRANIYHMRGELDEAYDLVKRWKEHLEVSVPDLFATALTWVLVGGILVSKGEIDAALEIIGKIETFAERSGGLWCLSDVHLLKARVMFAMDRIDEGNQYLLQAEAESRRIGSKRGELFAIAACVEYLADAWSKQEAQSFASKAEAIVGDIRAQIISEPLSESFMTSGSVARINDWLSTLNRS
jgi:tetratricopeptide (TPR) repeat protein